MYFWVLWVVLGRYILGWTTRWPAVHCDALFQRNCPTQTVFPFVFWLWQFPPADSSQLRSPKSYGHAVVSTEAKVPQLRGDSARSTCIADIFKENTRAVRVQKVGQYGLHRQMCTCKDLSSNGL